MADLASGVDRERGRTIETVFDGLGALMAWVDDRIWCHPKFVVLSDRAFRVWTHGCAYSTGFGLRGRLEQAHQLVVGSSPKVRRELIAGGVWDEAGEGAVMIHDWDDHNRKRDDRRAADRERKRAARSNGASAGQSAGRNAGQTRVDGSEGSEGSDQRPLLLKTDRRTREREAAATLAHLPNVPRLGAL